MKVSKEAIAGRKENKGMNGRETTQVNDAQLGTSWIQRQGKESVRLIWALGPVCCHYPNQGVQRNKLGWE